MPVSLSRRGFLALSGVGTAALLASRAQAAQALGVPEESLVLVPADKALPAGWAESLAGRGSPTRYTGAALQHIGMPVGGGCTGQLYLGGDGRLWGWDVFNRPAIATGDGAYANPRTPTSPFRQGFAIRTRTGGTGTVRSLDADGFPDVSFTGRYPLGQVVYRAPDAAVEVTLEAFSPFVPLSVDDSTIPATVLAYTVRNTSHHPVELDLFGWAESPVCLDTRAQRPLVLTSTGFGSGTAQGFQFDAHDAQLPNPRPDIVFEEFEKDTYAGWTVQGQAFGSGPALVSQLPGYMLRFGGVNAVGSRLVTSHNFRLGADAGAADAYTGTLTSQPFIIERRFINLLVGGGNHPGQECVNVVVDGTVVASATGLDNERMSWRSFDLRRYEGRTAVIEIVDARTDGWGHINCDQITFSDKPASDGPLTEVPDYGTFALAALHRGAVVRPSVADWSTPAQALASADGPASVDSADGTLAGTVTVPMRLDPHEARTVRFVIGWYFPVPDRNSLAFLTDAATLRRHYATRFGAARDVVSTVARDLHRLEASTRAWVDTWYNDSTLPHWFLERTLATSSTIATGTCYRFDNGRFYGWEGVYCCAGTCEHVWNYAQAIARLFPQLERDTRERVDLGLGFHPDTGEVGNRAEADMGWATDGMCGMILRCYREHLTSADAGYLHRIWPRLKQAVGFVMGRDAGRDGTLEGPQPNTLDTTWYGEISWITGMYVAALYAAAAMADESGDPAFAAECRRRATLGAQFLATTLWSGEYFIQRVDPGHAQVINSNRGCHIDQMFGQSLARQLGLPRVFPQEASRTALQSLYKYNFTPDPARYRTDHPVISGGRWFAMAGESGMLMTTWPHGGEETAAGNPASWAAIYFNEIWTGQEYQVATQMFDEGLVDEGLVMTRAIHDRYSATKRNPYNEVECGDHYARAMAGYAVFLAACGFEYHGPNGHIGFAPKLSPENFAAAYTAAEGWGRYEQRRHGAQQVSRIEVRYGRLRIRSLAFHPPAKPETVSVRIGGKRITVASSSYRDGRLLVTLAADVTLPAGSAVEVTIAG
jgi:uncharacterized protein (DUF608 family)